MTMPDAISAGKREKREKRAKSPGRTPSHFGLTRFDQVYVKSCRGRGALEEGEKKKKRGSGYCIRLLCSYVHIASIPQIFHPSAS